MDLRGPRPFQFLYCPHHVERLPEACSRVNHHGMRIAAVMYRHASQSSLNVISGSLVTSWVPS